MSYASRKFPQQIKKADELGARYTVILGEDEVAKGVAKLRNQQTKEETESAIDAIVTPSAAEESE